MTVENHYHYQVIRRAISHIDQAETPLTLEGLATDLGMSSQHFQKVFSKWAGVSPKRYQQYLTLDHAKTLMKTRHTLLDVTSDVGLTSTGRLHDLFLRWEAMSPGDYARKGAGLQITFGWLETPFGEALAMATPRGLCGLGFTSEIGREASFADLSGRWPNATFVENLAEVRPFVEAALSGGTAQLQLIGGPFQIKVWEALLSIPSGDVTTYGDIAAAIGNPKAVRAVGTAVGRNPISWLIPCHRVLRKSGDLGGYHWGTPVKRALLAYETVQAEARP
ncbi:MULTISPECIES: methylated-DNA--[protein]-cysteine S-methyltransferase [Pacificibacter]|uniref:methylated-DNA--[protein]-cysteine S-methyltransferase n=1 Tax=Pacificibacter TaxID=1042323 RepID=UPI001C0A58D4|nr:MULTISPECIES: bifunctional helix-turn-helix domain-containing protein/methylated-DNA--[protein]-cysteine S-methyltransferase [Pacificibacter]MBU2936609.1 bifunctional helix-turn-helix domain-containing protein/methylated-DNA--[protein]-cysteine S-methyltransferase [Pacificibacter marinus]MDO6614588.1 bifunctional helix-turn-helix domain-containing protein/methylated-DNA--[protein]-cysteine S-methyltransferase [Pacificibacter sp. 1_MG-2023]